MGYTTTSNVRERIGNCAGWTDPILQPLIDRASNFIDFVTGQFFEPREMVITLDGTDSQTLLVPLPIIDITKIELIDWPGNPSGIGDVGLDIVAVYNRHLSEQLTHPDDRKNPKIAFLGSIVSPDIETIETWPVGKRNVRLTGRFGFTNPDFDAGRSVATNALDTITAPNEIHMELGSFTDEDIGKTITISGSASNDGSYVIDTVVGAKDITIEEQTLTTEGDGFVAALSAFPQWGVTPPMIKEVCELLIIRDLPPVPGGGISGPQDGEWYDRMMRSQGRVTQEKVRDQSISYQGAGSTGGNISGVITGDPIIDMYLLAFTSVTAMRAV